MMNATSQQVSRRVVWMLLVLGPISGIVWAQVPDKGPEQAPGDCSESLACVVAIPAELDLGRPVVVEVVGLGPWLSCRKKSAAGLRLFLGGRELESISAGPSVVAPDSPSADDMPLRKSCGQAADERTSNSVTFNWTRVPRTDETWRWLLENQHWASTEATVSVGLTGDSKPLAVASRVSGGGSRPILLVNRSLTYWAVAGLIGVLVAMYFLARYSGLLRDEGDNPNPRKRPYSLARVQMAWWTILILGGFVAVSLIQGAITDIPSGLIGLLGISAGTFVAAQFVAPSGGGRSEGRGIVNDLLSDDKGAITLHRFQIALWTVALGVMFVADICGRLEMRELPTNLLGLMGISNGVYLGFKAKEEPKP